MATEKRKKKLFSCRKSTELLRSIGDTYCIVTYWNSFAHKSVDAWGFQDIQFLRKGVTGVTAINACGEDISTHVKDYMEGDDWLKGRIRLWLECGNRFFIWAWRKRVHRLKDGSKGKDKRWDMKELEFLLENNAVVVRETNVKT